MARKMKDSGIEWIGEIPEGWEVVQLKRFAEVHNGREIDVEVDSTDSSAVGVYGSGGVFKYTNRAQYSGKAVLFGRKGTLGKPLYVEGQLWAVDTMYFLTYSNRLLEKFSYYQFLAFNWAPYITHTAIPSVVASEIVACYFPIPPLEEQAKIVDYLDNSCASLDTILDKTRSSIEEYKKLKQAVITQAVTKGVRGEREMKDSGVEWIGEIPKEWVCERIKYATSISRGLFNHRPRNDERYYNGKYPFIQTGDVANATKYIVSYSQTLNELGKSVSKEFPKGTLTMTIAANVGDVAILNFDAYFPDSVVGFIPNKNIRTLYLFYVFSAMKDEFTRTAIKSTQLNLNIDRVKETFIPVTHDSNEQCEIENYLESKCAEIDGLIAKKEQLVKELESYKKSLIYEVVTGKREV